jgi:hypothetical protein
MGQRRERRQKRANKAPRLSAFIAAPVTRDPLSPLLAAGVMLVALIVYLQTAARDIVVGDSTEFVTIALSGGVAHPPGYPLLILLARLFLFFPFGTEVFRVNLVSVVAGVATAGLIVVISRRLGASRAGSVIAGLLVAFQPIVWEWSLAIEAFALNAALTSAIIYFLVRWYQKPEATHFLILAALFGGLASSNHQTIIFLVPSILVMLWWHRDLLVGKPFVIAACVVAIMVGLLPYLFILSEAQKDATLNWGNVRTFGQLVNHFLRADYGTTKLAAQSMAAGSAPSRLVVFLTSFTLLEALLLPVGAAIAYRRARWFFWFALVSFLLAGPALVTIANLDVDDDLITQGRWMLEHFFVLPHVIVAPFAALGFTFAAEWLAKRVSTMKGSFAEAFVGVTAAGLIAISISRHYRELDQSTNQLARTFAEDILATVPPRGVLMAFEDQVVLPVTYLQSVEKKRPDVTLVMLGRFRGADGAYIREMRRKHPEVKVPFEQYNRYVETSTTKALFDANPGTAFAVVGAPLDSSFTKAYWMYQYGLVNAILPMATDVSLEQAESDFQLMVSKYRVPDPAKVKLATYERRILRAYAQPYLRLAEQYRLLNRPGPDSLLRRAAELDPP